MTWWMLMGCESNSKKWCGWYPCSNCCMTTWWVNGYCTECDDDNG